MTREPDRFDAQARDVSLQCSHTRGAGACRDCFAAALRAAAFAPLGDNHHNAAACPHCGDLLSKERVKAEASALERAAQFVESGGAADISLTTGSLIADRIRALIPPAAAHAACPETLLDHRCDEEGPHEQHRAENAGEGGADLVWTAAAPAAEPRLDNLAAESPPPAAETGKAQGDDDTNVPDDIDPRNFEKYDAGAQKRIAELETALLEAQGQLCAEHCEWTGSGDHDDQCVKLSKALRAAPPKDPPAP